jgi:hypothetical protein
MYKLLDVYSGAGLAAIGYKQAGFHVTGVDNEKITSNRSAIIESALDMYFSSGSG